MSCLPLGYVSVSEEEIETAMKLDETFGEQNNENDTPVDRT